MDGDIYKAGMVSVIIILFAILNKRFAGYYI